MTPSHAWFTELGDLAVPDWVLALADFELPTPAVFRRFDELYPEPPQPPQVSHAP